MRLGLKVIIALAILTAIEYAVAVQMDAGANAILVALILLKTGLILEYFMHLSRLWRVEE